MQRFRSTSVLFKALALLVALIVVVAILELTGVTHFIRHKNTAILTPSAPTTGGASVNNDKGEPKQTSTAGTLDSDNNSGSQNTQTENNKTVESGNTNAPLDTPSGNFVSDHMPTLSGSPGPHETSVCTTTPGAKCTISFSNGTDTKSLDARTTDAGGSAYWDWSIQDIGLTTGSWKITATATLNGQTKSASDSLELKVK